jgi:hypothetical protein
MSLLLRRRIFVNKEELPYTEIAGNKWCNTNLTLDSNGNPTFVNRPDGTGYIWQFNRKKGWPPTGSVTGWPTSYLPHGDWAPENDPSPAGYRLPTRDDLQALLNLNAYSKIQAGERGFLEQGIIFGQNHATATINNMQGCILIPYVGGRLWSNGEIVKDTSILNGLLHSSTSYRYSLMYSLEFDNPPFIGKAGLTTWGIPLRCIKI